MEKKTVSGIVFILLLVSILTLTFNIRTVKGDWVGIVTIRADGSVDPPTAPIATINNVTYTLTDNINGSVIVERSNIIIDGNKCVVQGFRIYEVSVNNVTIQNANIEGSDFGILFDSSSNNTVLGNNITAASEYGIYCQWSSGNFIYGNRITNSAAGIRLQKSSNNTLRYNIMTNNTYNFGVFGTDFSHFMNDIDVSNTVDGKSIHYLINQHNMLISSEAGYVGLINCTGITAENLNLSKNLEGVLLAYTTNSTITQCNITNNMDGIMLYYSSNNTITGNNITANDWYGIGFTSGRWPCGNNTIFDNNIKSNGKTGIYLQGSHNTISENNITANIEYGIYIQEGSKTIIHKNNITGNGQGIFLDESSNNTVSLNFIAENSEGAILLSSSADYNTFSQNTIIANNGSRGYYPSVIDIRGSWNIIHKNNVTANKVTAIGVFGSHNNVSENYVAKNEYGIQLYYSSDNIICRNNISESNMVGLLLIMSSNNIISDNVFANDGMAVAESYSNTVEDNLVNGKPLIYLENVSGYAVQEAGQVILVNCTSIEVENLSLSYTPVGIQLSHTTNTNITNNHITNNTVGTYLSYSSNYNTISQNSLTNNDYGIYLYHSSNNKMIGNNITANNESGVYIGYSSGNMFYHNNFIGNTKHVNVEPSGYINTWDNSYPSGGNYWDNYTGIDANSDGIGDDEHVIDANNTDRYPLIAPITAFDAGVWNGVAYNVDVVSNSTLSDFHFNPDEGAFLRFNVTGEDGTKGFCRVTIPKDLLWVQDGQWSVLVGGEPVNYTIIPDENYTYLYFTYNHSTKTVEIQGTDVIPEFPLSVLLLGLLILITTILTFAKKKRFKKAKT